MRLLDHLLVVALPAHTKGIFFLKQGGTKHIGCSRMPKCLQWGGEAVAEGVGRGFVVAAGEDGTVGGDDAAGPETVTGTAAGTMEMVQPIRTQAVAAVAGRRGHERVTVLIIIELRRLEGEA